MNTAKRAYSNEVLAQATQALNTLDANVGGIVAAVLLSADGFEISSIKVSSDSASRLAAMGSSLAAISVSIAQEGGLSDSRRLMLESQDGVISVSRIKANPELTLMMIVDDPATLGKLAWATKSCCNNLTQLFAG